MNITDLVNRELGKSEDKFGKENELISLLRQSLTSFGYKVLKEISRLNFPAFTYTEDDDLTKQGFCNMVLNYLVDKGDSTFGDIHFTEYKNWFKDVSSETDKLMIVKRANGKYDFAKFDEEKNHWFNQDNEIIYDVCEWRTFLPSYMN
jgi:hypothetical protein